MQTALKSTQQRVNPDLPSAELQGVNFYSPPHVDFFQDALLEMGYGYADLEKIAQNTRESLPSHLQEFWEIHDQTVLYLKENLVHLTEKRAYAYFEAVSMMEQYLSLLSMAQVLTNQEFDRITRSFLESALSLNIGDSEMILQDVIPYDEKPDLLTAIFRPNPEPIQDESGMVKVTPEMDMEARVIFFTMWRFGPGRYDFDNDGNRNHIPLPNMGLGDLSEDDKHWYEAVYTIENTRDGRIVSIGGTQEVHLLERDLVQYLRIGVPDHLQGRGLLKALMIPSLTTRFPENLFKAVLYSRDTDETPEFLFNGTPYQRWSNSRALMYAGLGFKPYRGWINYHGFLNLPMVRGLHPNPLLYVVNEPGIDVIPLDCESWWNQYQKRWQMVKAGHQALFAQVV
jgi:hypothetical protein